MKRMLCLTLFSAAICAGALAVAFTSSDTSAQQGSNPQELVAAKAEKVDFKAELTDGWKAATMVEMASAHARGRPGPSVELRAQHDGEYVYIMAQWKDATKSDTKQAWEYKDGAWSKSEGDEDRIAFAFGGNAAGFETKGCGALCHDGEMRTTGKDEIGDLWHWKAARGGQNGECDDQHFAGGDKGRPDDAGKSAYETNADKVGKAPKWVWKEGADTGAAFTADTARELPADFKPENGYRVPSIRLRAPEGSRADLKSAAAWADGVWTVVIKRKLDTGNKDDVQFKVGESASFAVALLDNKGVKDGHDHSKTALVKLVIK